MKTKKMTRDAHFTVFSTVNKLNILDKDNIKAAIWLSRTLKAVEAEVGEIEKLKQKIEQSEFNTKVESVRKECMESHSEKNEDGTAKTKEVKNDEGQVVGMEYLIEDKEAFAKDLTEIFKALDQSEDFKSLREKHEENVKALNTFLQEEVEINYPTLSADVYEKSFSVDIQDIFVLEDLLVD
jgi:hypothetical protein